MSALPYKSLELIKDSFLKKTFLQAVFSPIKTVCRILPSGQIQITEHKGALALHKNLSQNDFCDWVSLNFKKFKQVQIFTRDNDFHIFLPEEKILKRKASLKEKKVTHNRQKNYLLETSFLDKLKISKDKFKQVERFCEIVEPLLPLSDTKMEIVDFGCGKAYLTFALYQFLLDRNKTFHLTGLDLKKDVLERNTEWAKELKFDHMIFKAQNIEQFEGKIDIGISLHACDIATDIALGKCIQAQAKIILAAPCCQHELYNQIKNTSLSPLIDKGLFKERLASLATDAARVALLESFGYEVQVIEFIDAVHTPKNILLSAVFKPNHLRMEKAKKSYASFKEALSITPYLEKLLNNSQKFQNDNQ